MFQITAKQTTFFLLFLALALFVFYIYLLSVSVVHVVMRTEINKSIQDLSAEISQYEKSYISAQHQVSKNIATHTGYVSIKEKVFIDRSEPQLVLYTSVNQ